VARKIKKNLRKDNKKITFTPLFIEAVVRYKEISLINSSLDNYTIVMKRIIISAWPPLPNGNLIVPVIKNADQLNLVDFQNR
jgi:2-oxoglutarate dehydrogenase E2 component (dihydrolipoamide succinyltransferase)